MTFVSINSQELLMLVRTRRWGSDGQQTRLAFVTGGDLTLFGIVTRGGRSRIALEIIVIK